MIEELDQDDPTKSFIEITPDTHEVSDVIQEEVDPNATQEERSAFSAMRSQRIDFQIDGKTVMSVIPEGVEVNGVLASSPEALEMWKQYMAEVYCRLQKAREDQERLAGPDYRMILKKYVKHMFESTMSTGLSDERLATSHIKFDNKEISALKEVNQEMFNEYPEEEVSPMYGPTTKPEKMPTIKSYLRKLFG